MTTSTDAPTSRAEALAGVAAGAIGWVLGPSAARWFVQHEDRTEWPPGEPEPERWYDLLGFDGRMVWRWTQSTPDGRGVLTTVPVPAVGDTALVLTSLLAGSPITAKAGEPGPAGERTTWTWLRAGNGTRFAVPIDAGKAAVALHQVEVLGTDEHGNVRVVDTLPTGLSLVGDER